jgi:Ca2+-binding EF-hand superfamily protein
MKFDSKTRHAILATVAGVAVTASVLMAQPGGHRGPGPDGHGPMSAADADKDGNVTAAEWTALFEKLDANSDGALSADELPIRRHFTMGTPPPGAAAGLVAHDADTNRDGAVTREEFDARLAAIDANSDGDVTMEELHARHERHGRGPGAEGFRGLPPFLAEADADKDGKLSVSELEAQFEAADADSDGALREGEIGFHFRVRSHH